MRRLLCFMLLSLCALSTSTTDACTGIRLKTADGQAVHGRTVEFGEVILFSTVVVPRNYPFEGHTPNGTGMKYSTKYGSVGVMTFDDVAMMDGLNEKGLSVGTFYFPGFASYATITPENQNNALSPIEFPNWILTQFETVDQVKAGLKDVVIAPTVNKAWGSTPPPFHYIVYEKSGKSIVIEPLDGKLKVYDNPIGAFTNSPTFDWHLENLRNYINLTTWSAKPININGLELSPFGMGSGMVGLPGDFTPPSRFVRASIYSVAATPPKNSQEGIFQVLHILNQFDIPVGVAQNKSQDGVVHTDYTMLTVARDPQSLQYYYRSYDDQTIRMIDLKAFDLNAKEIKRMRLSGSQTFVDESKNLATLNVQGP